MLQPEGGCRQRPRQDGGHHLQLHPGGRGAGSGRQPARRLRPAQRVRPLTHCWCRLCSHPPPVQRRRHPGPGERVVLPGEHRRPQQPRLQVLRGHTVVRGGRKVGRLKLRTSSLLTAIFAPSGSGPIWRVSWSTRSPKVRQSP